MTAFFDLLTYPLITLGVPLITHFAETNREENESAALVYVKELLLYSVSWGMGYIGMWAGKWIVATCFTDENIISDGFDRIRFRSSHISGDEVYTWASTIKENINACNKTVLLAVMAILILGIMLYRTGTKSWINKADLYRIVIILIISLYPFIWYCMTMNHSSLHGWFITWRELAISVYGITAILCMNLYKPSKE